MSTKALSVVTLILFLVSIGVYSNETKRGTGLIEGSDFIKGLDIGKINKVVVSGKDQEKATLVREGSYFVLEDHKSYPAATEKINDLIYKIASIQIKEKISSGVDDSDLDKFELDDKNRRFLIEIFDNDGKKTVSFRVGKSKGKGSYLYKEGDDSVYLSSSSVWLASGYKSLINTKLLAIKTDELESATLNGDQAKKEKIKELTSKIGSVYFDEFFEPNDNEIKGATFDQSLVLELKNKLQYRVSLGKAKIENTDKYFAKVNAYAGEIPNKIEVSQNDGKEQLLKIDDMVKAQGSAQRFNFEKSRWVYQIDKSTYEKLTDSQFY